MTRAWLACAALALLGACGDEAVPAAQLGAAVFRDPKLSTSPYNAFSCATCHTVAPGAGAVVPGRLDSGYNLADTVGRASWWGGYETRLLDAINVCFRQFMGGNALAPDDERARELYEYLAASSAATPAGPLPLTLVRDVAVRPALAGDAQRGRDAWDRACRRCHGDAHTGHGRATALASLVPEDSVKTFGAKAPVVVVEKIRHGRFFNIGGLMPLYSIEAMSDQTVADLLAFLGL